MVFRIQDSLDQGNIWARIINQDYYYTQLDEKNSYFLLIFWNSAVDLVDLDFPENELLLEVATATVNIHLIMIITTLEMITI